jgi:integrase/recombinase XerD
MLQLWRQPRTLRDPSWFVLANYRDAYGRWLTFLQLSGTFDPAPLSAARATPEAVAKFIAQLRTQVAPLTVAQRIIGLEQVLRAFAPEQNWVWLRTIARGLSKIAHPVRNKRARIRSSDELAAAGLSLMAEAEAAIGGHLRRRADLYCDGLMLALLAMRADRLTNFVGIRLGQHLQRVGPGWTLCFAAEETKTRQPKELPFPEELVEHLERYLGHWRRILLGTTSSDRFWISSKSSPLEKCGVRLRIRRATICAKSGVSVISALM